MYKKIAATKTTLKVNKGYKAESLERKIFRMFNNNEPLENTAPLIYTERKEGVLPATNIRTDKWEVAAEAMDAAHKGDLAKREYSIGARAFEGMNKEAKEEFVKKFPTSEIAKNFNKGAGETPTTEA